jgi:hypothetical protein
MAKINRPDHDGPTGSYSSPGLAAATSTPFNTTFEDIAKREDDARRRARERKALLELNLKKNGALPPEQEDELKELTARLILADRGQPIDPLFKAVQAELGRSGQQVANHTAGRFPGNLGRAELTAASIIGILIRNSQEASGYETRAVDGDIQLVVSNASLASRFAKNFSIARGEFTADQALYRRVTQIVDQESGVADLVRASQVAAVVRALVAQGVPVTDPYLTLKVLNALGAQEGTSDNAPPSSIVIDLPNLEDNADIVIVADNLRAQQALFFSAMLEELKVYQVVDKLVELFQNCMLPLGKGSAGDLLYGYWKKSINRISEIERRNMYARSFGIPGGDATSLNVEYDELFIRFVSAVSSYVRQFAVDELFTTKTPLMVSQQQVQKSGRDLGASLSLHGYGIAYFAATELQTQIKDAFAILNDPEIRGAYGARDAFQLVDQVATLELGGARNSFRYRSMANAGAIIIGWLAERAALLNSPTRVRIIDIDQIRDDAPRPLGTKAITKPNDRDLVDACEQWLSVTGTTVDSAEHYAERSEAPNLATTPIRIPDVAREMLDSVGIPATQAYRARA